MAVLMNVLFCVAWLPFAVMCFWTAFASSDSVPHYLALISPLAVKTSTLFNPFIYYFTNEKLRAAINAVLGRADEFADELEQRNVEATLRQREDSAELRDSIGSSSRHVPVEML
jgi:hypothetical protein